MIRYFKLRRAMMKVFQENDELFKMLAEAEKETPTNLTWDEDGVWKSWIFNPDQNRYYFNDIGNESIIALWDEQSKLEGTNDL